MLNFYKMRYIIISLLLFSFFAYPQTDLLKDSKKEQSRIYRDNAYKLQMQGDLAGALSFYKKAIELDPTYVEAINDIGVIYELMGDLDSALSFYEQAIKIDESYLPAYTNLAFLYEKKGDILNATEYWVKRYELGKEGEYWREVAAQHLLKLGTYPEVKRRLLEKEAIKLSKELVYTREQERLKLLEEVKLHLDIGLNLYSKGDYASALKEFSTVLSLNPPDETLKLKAMELYKKVDFLQTKNEAVSCIENALNDIKKEDFLSAGEKLKEAMSKIFNLSRQKSSF